ncbi:MULTISPECIES: hypothetical protein [unclassified Lentimicrobium]|uniref:hypothetical protein n=1 Tax=unclassified Lentimicrobium TaxID=2677434 RepID=UPI001552F6AD|nr:MULTISPECIES: hypothetical protein [unclassified Lentimicrobium]NPD47070.1 hypothetical protein [Lentimicrobium sp. S6]NPD84418.1 hypothetical protein [Lentimicrobium sp. L6]
MKRTILLLIAMSTFIFSGYCQNQKLTFSSNPSLSFEKYISGVKYAEIGLNPFNQEQVDNKTGIAGFYYLAKKYLQQMGFEYVALTSKEKTELSIAIKSYCEYSLVMFGGEINKNSVSDMTISFISCNGDVFSFTSDKTFKYGKFTHVENKLVEDWKSIVKSKGIYKASNQLQLPSNPTIWTREKLNLYFAENKGNLDPMEGIYERVRLSFEDLSAGKYTVGIIKNPVNDGFLVVYLSGAKNISDWESGDVKAIFNNTATKGFYTVHWVARDKSIYEDVYCNTESLGFSIFSSGMLPISYKFIKMSPR